MDIILREYGRIIRIKWFWFLLVILGVCGGIGLEMIAPLFYKNLANGLTEPFSDATLAMLLDNLLMIGLIYASVWMELAGTGIRHDSV